MDRDGFAPPRALPLGLAVALSLLGYGVARAAPEGPRITIAPTLLDQSRERTATLRIAGHDRLRIVAGRGRIDAPLVDAAGTTVRYHAPERALPGTALFLVSTEDCRTSVAALPMRAPATVSLRVWKGKGATDEKRRGTVRLTVGDRVFGPVSTDAKGRAVVHVLLGPDDTSYLAATVDHLGNEGESTAPLPEPPAPPPIAVVCPVSVRAGGVVRLDAAAVGGRGAPSPVQVVAPAGIRVRPVAAEGAWSRFELAIDGGVPPGAVEVEVRTQAGATLVRLDVLPAPPPPPAILEAPPPPPPPPPPVVARPAIAIGADAGFVTNTGVLLGADVMLSAGYRLRPASRRFGLRAELGLLALAGQSAASMPPILSLDALAAPIQAGASATLWRPGPLELDVEASGGASLLRTRVTRAQIALVTTTGVIPSLRTGVALRFRRGRGSLALRASYRHLFGGADTMTGGLSGNGDYVSVSLGGELNLL